MPASELPRPGPLPRPIDPGFAVPDPAFKPWPLIPPPSGWDPHAIDPGFVAPEDSGFAMDYYEEPAKAEFTTTDQPTEMEK
jgi:hypothetical protein